MPHHTKDKGDLAVFHVEADLAERGYVILIPRTEHSPFDLVAYDGERFLRIQVKYRAAVGGAIPIRFSSSWADRHGVHTVPMDKSQVDVLAAFCPDTRKCYYLLPAEFRVMAWLRICPPVKNQKKRIRFAEDYLAFPPERKSSIAVVAAEG